MNTNRRDAMAVMAGAAAAATVAGPASAQAARNVGSNVKTLFWVASTTPCDKNLKFDPGAMKDAGPIFQAPGCRRHRGPGHHGRVSFLLGCRT